MKKWKFSGTTLLLWLFFLWLVVKAGLAFYLPIGFILNQEPIAQVITGYMRALEAEDAQAAYAFRVQGERFLPDKRDRTELQILEDFLKQVEIRFDRIDINQVSCLAISFCLSLRVTTTVYYPSGETQEADFYLRRSQGTWKIINFNFDVKPARR